MDLLYSICRNGCIVHCLFDRPSSVNARRTAALATAYSLSESALKEYQEKVIETIGGEKNRAYGIRLRRDKLKRDPVVVKRSDYYR